MFVHTSRNNGQGKVSLRPQQEMEELSEEAQPVGSARTRSLLLSGPASTLTLLEELQVNTWSEKLRKGPQEEFDYSHFDNMKPENASHSCQASKQFWTTEEVHRDMWRGTAYEQTKNKEAATRCDSLLRRYRWTLVQLEIKIWRCYTFVTHTMNCLPRTAFYFYLAWWLANSDQRRLTPGFGFNYHILGKQENWWLNEVIEINCKDVRKLQAFMLIHKLLGTLNVNINSKKI